jgi:hypothetical protein
MKTIPLLSALTGLLVQSVLASQPALTIYNQDFAVVRDSVPLDLKAGVNDVRFAEATAQLEPDSVILRDPSGKHTLKILEQNYRNDPVSQSLLLSFFEGKTIPFQNVVTRDNTQVRESVMGKVIRSGHLPNGGQEQPIIEVDGKLQFSLPGEPLFPSLGDDTILKPTLNWLLQSDEPGKFDAEISYVTDGFTWQADYNLVAPEKGDLVDIVGWITMNNQSGKTFENAQIKLMAGDVNKIRPRMRTYAYAGGGSGGGGEPAVSEKSFDEYHLYTLAHPTTLHNQQMKQVEFVRAEGVRAPVVYIYDGVDEGIRFLGGVNDDQNYGTQCNKKVWVAREFVNSESNHLGMPLPKGKLRFYRDDNGQLEFTGENTIDHTPRNELIHLTTGNSFDLVGERKRTDIKVYFVNQPAPSLDPTTGAAIPPTPPPANGPPPPWIDESFEISLRNHKREAVEIRVVEHLYRWSNWSITAKSDDFKKTDAQTIEFRVNVKPDEEKKVTYTVHYAW